MNKDRNIDGLLKSAQDKREQAIKRANMAINELEKNNSPITFANVARQGNVSKAWLYREDNIRKKIDLLRQNNGRSNIQKNNAGNSNARIDVLKKKIQTLESENKQLKKQLEKVYGELFKASL